MYKSIQAGRAIAALSVSAYHLSIMMGDSRYGGEAVFQNWTMKGSLGVDFFFVLSGFIILLAHHADIGKSDQLSGYLSKRVIRLYPIYLLYTAALSALVLLGVGAITLPTTWVGWFSAISLVRFSDESPPLEVAWTLFHEIMFYALFSVLIWSRRAGMIVLSVWGLSCIAMYHYPGTTERSALSVYTSAYNLNFLLGMGAYTLYKRTKFSWAAIVGGAITIAVGVALAYADSEHNRIVFAVGCALLMGGLVAIEQTRNIRIPKFLILIGNASYTIYLTHNALQGLALKIAAKVGIAEAVGLHFTFIIVFAVATAAGCVAYKLVEAPLLRFARVIVMKQIGLQNKGLT